MQKRAAALRCWLWKRPEENIALVTHGAFLHYLTEDWRGLVVPRGVYCMKAMMNRLMNEKEVS